MVAAVIAILDALPSTPSTSSPRAELLIEIAKILVTAVVLGILGSYAKSILERLQEQRQQAEARLAAKIALLDALQKSTRKALQSLRDNKANAASFGTWLSHEDGNFEDMLVMWQILEPKAAQEVHSTYLTLEDLFTKSGPTLDFRNIAIKEVLAWQKRFQQSAIGFGQPTKV